ncbi:hypothetical protein VT85_14720 [Planctomyces sp. SH-PL62]|nr:hypothetical protein VT85_14720 [Planctomyces sp. SH-PL62]
MSVAKRWHPTPIIIRHKAAETPQKAPGTPHKAPDRPWKTGAS